MGIIQNSACEWVQLVKSIPERWNYIVKKKNSTNLISHDHHLMNSSNVIALDKLTSNKIYSALSSKIYLYVI